MSILWILISSKNIHNRLFLLTTQNFRIDCLMIHLMLYKYLFNNLFVEGNYLSSQAKKNLSKGYLYKKILVAHIKPSAFYMFSIISKKIVIER